MSFPLRLSLLAALVLLGPAAGAQTCSDGTWGVRTSVRAETPGDTLHLYIALAGDPAETVGSVRFWVYHTLNPFVGFVDWDAHAPSSSPFNQPPYETSWVKCLASPMCDDNFFVTIGGSGGPHRPFPEEPVDILGPFRVMGGSLSAAGLEVRDVQATNGSGADVPVCPPGDQAAWGAPVVRGEEGPEGVGIELSVAPNPVRGASAVGFTLPMTGPARLVLLDVLGREVAVLADGPAEAGGHQAALDGARLPAGAYLLRLDAGGARLVRRATVVR